MNRKRILSLILAIVFVFSGVAVISALADDDYDDPVYVQEYEEYLEHEVSRYYEGKYVILNGEAIPVPRREFSERVLMTSNLPQTLYFVPIEGMPSSLRFICDDELSSRAHLGPSISEINEYLLATGFAVGSPEFMDALVRAAQHLIVSHEVTEYEILDEPSVSPRYYQVCCSHPWPMTQETLAWVDIWNPVTGRWEGTWRTTWITVCHNCGHMIWH